MTLISIKSMHANDFFFIFCESSSIVTFGVTFLFIFFIRIDIQFFENTWRIIFISSNLILYTILVKLRAVEIRGNRIDRQACHPRQHERNFRARYKYCRNVLAACAGFRDVLGRGLGLVCLVSDWSETEDQTERGVRRHRVARRHPLPRVILHYPAYDL